MDSSSKYRVGALRRPVLYPLSYKRADERHIGPAVEPSDGLYIVSRSVPQVEIEAQGVALVDQCILGVTW
jgi:hypothetical protein